MSMRKVLVNSSVYSRNKQSVRYCPPVILQELLINRHYAFQTSAVITDDAVAQICSGVIRGYGN